MSEQKQSGPQAGKTSQRVLDEGGWLLEQCRDLWGRILEDMAPCGSRASELPEIELIG